MLCVSGSVMPIFRRQNACTTLEELCAQLRAEETPRYDYGWTKSTIVATDVPPLIVPPRVGAPQWRLDGEYAYAMRAMGWCQKAKAPKVAYAIMKRLVDTGKQIVVHKGHDGKKIWKRL